MSARGSIRSIMMGDSRLDVSAWGKLLQAKPYDERKKGALELERLIRDQATDDVKKLHDIIAFLCTLSTNKDSNTRCGGIMGMAGVSIALGPKIAEYLGGIVPPVLACFNDTDSKVRYFACESMYNVAKVAKGEIFVFFNEIFDAMSKLVADTDPSVKNGAELLDRLIKDIVTEQASTYVASANVFPAPLSPRPSSSGSSSNGEYDKDNSDRAFSLPRFIPLLHERIYVLNPFTRTYLVSWITVLDSVPELELISYLPEFLDGLLKFLGDPTVEIRTATQNALADLLSEVRQVAEVQRARDEAWRTTEDEEDVDTVQSRRASQLGVVVETDDHPEERHEAEEGAEQVEEEETDVQYLDDGDEGEGSGEWIPGQNVHVDHAAIVEILLRHLSFADEEIQSTCLRWIAEFLTFCQPTMVPLTPRLLPVILSSLAHHVASIRTAAIETNFNLYNVIRDFPVAPSHDPHPPISPSPSALSKQPEVPSTATGRERERTVTNSPPPSGIPFPGAQQPAPASSNRLTSADRPVPWKPGPNGALAAISAPLLPPVVDSVVVEGRGSRSSFSEAPPSTREKDSPHFDYGATVNALTLQFLSEHEETRVAALEWLLMLHQKAPQRILAIDEPSGDASSRSQSRVRAHQDGSESGLSIALLLKMLSDPSEKVLRGDLRLLSQILYNSEDEYFPTFMMSLLSLFSTDRRLLETRGSLIIRELCLSLNTERIYRTFAEILEKDEDLEFASIMVQNLNLIMITSPELADFRKRLRTLESKDGQALFTILYRSWSHNAIATFSLCLLAQAYEQAYSLLQIFADLEITVSLLIQIDKLVQLLESPVFTALRLQLLEPERYPYLLKAMYGLLMLLPQSSAFATLRNRLSAVSSLGFLQAAPRPSTTAAAGSRSTLRRGDDVRWNELLTHFRQVQKRRSSAAVSLASEAMDGVAGGHPVSSSNGNSAPSSLGANGSATNLAARGGSARGKAAPVLGRTDSSGSVPGGTPHASSSSPMGWRPPGLSGALFRPASPTVPQKNRRFPSAPSAPATGKKA